MMRTTGMNNVRPLVMRGAAALTAMVLLSGCRGFLFEQTPIHPNMNMDNVTYIEAQEPSTFFADGRGMRPQVHGTVAVGALDTDHHLYRGQVDGVWSTTLPEAVLSHFSGTRRGAVHHLLCTLSRWRRPRERRDCSAARYHVVVGRAVTAR